MLMHNSMLTKPSVGGWSLNSCSVTYLLTQLVICLFLEHFKLLIVSTPLLESSSELSVELHQANAVATDLIAW